MIVYNRETIGHRDRCKKVIVQQLSLIGNRKTNEELEDIVDNSLRGDFRVSAVVDVQKAKQSLNELEIRHQNLVKLEKTIQDVHEMIRQLAELVSKHGEMIDSIEHNVSKAAYYVKGATRNVERAKEYSKAAFIKKIIIIVVLIVAVLLIIFIILLGYLSQKKLGGK